MKLFGITVVDGLTKREPTRYRQDLPDNPERILAIFDGGKFVKLIDFIGPGLDYMNDAYGVECYLQDEEVTDLDGLLVFEGIYRSWTNYWGDYDEELDGRWRRLTEEDRECVKNDEYIWDPRDWYIFQEKMDTDAKHEAGLNPSTNQGKEYGLYI